MNEWDHTDDLDSPHLSSAGLTLGTLLERYDSNPERIMYLAVILQAILDATKPESPNEPEEEKEARQEAINWFMSSVGDLLKDFEDICEYAGVDAKEMKTYAYKVIVSKEIKYVRKRINTIRNFENL